MTSTNGEAEVLTSQRLLDDTLAIPERVRGLFDALVDIVDRSIGERDIADIDSIYLGGSGDLHHSALATEIAFERLTGLRASALPSMRMGLYAARAMSSHAVLLQMTFSGKTARAVESASLAREAGARIWGLTNNAHSELARISHVHLTKPETGGNEAAGYPITMLMLYLLALRMAELRRRVTSKQAALLRAQLAGASDDMQGTLDRCVGPARRLAERHAAARYVLFLGTGPTYASAVNGSARIHEATGINASPQDIEEWAHLNRWVEERESPTVLIAPRGPVCERAAEILDAMRTLGKPSIVVADERDTALGGKGDGWLPVRCDLPEEFSPLVYNLPGELFAHQLGVVRGSAPYRHGNPTYDKLGEIRWGGYVRRSLPEGPSWPAEGGT
jgi:glucosamine--fructose-6-phosphate aminotransferase (isomerizing)